MTRLIVLLLVAVIANAETRNLILITADGLRWQELFGGLDSALPLKESLPIRQQLTKPTPEERRTTLLPFFWGKLATSGVVLGNVKKNSSVQVTNGIRVSYPGYSEILTGRSQDEVVRGNDRIQNPSQTVLEFLREKLKLQQKQVALFSSWDTFKWIGESKPGSIFINAGYQSADDSPRMRELSRMQSEALTPWDATRHDYVTLNLALDHMKREKPRVTYIALGETDDWAHDRRYDRVLWAIQYFDQALQRIFDFVEHTPEYKDKALVVITSDHGRGSTAEDWHGHGSKVVGAEQIWLGIFGPGVPAKGEISGSEPAFQRDIAPTILTLMGINPAEYKGLTGRPLKLPR